jgi:integrase/recombinase XerD
VKSLSRHLEEYLDLRRRLGFKLRDARYELGKFIRFAQQEKASFITTKLAIRWASQIEGGHPAHRTTRLSMLRRFADYMSAVDPRTEVPPQGLLPHRYFRKNPYFYSDDEIDSLIKAAHAIPSPKGLRAATYSTLFGCDTSASVQAGRLASPEPAS